MAAYVVYVPGDGLSVGFKTLEDAMREANESLQEHQTNGEWTNGAEFIAVLQVVATVVDISKDHNFMDLKITPVNGMAKCSLEFSTEDE